MPSPAAERSLSGEGYSGFNREKGAIIINTKGQAALRIAFLQPAVVRIQFSPDGGFSNNPSPAVLAGVGNLVEPKIVDGASHLELRTASLCLRVNKQSLGVDAYDTETKTLLSADAATTWNDQTEAVGQSRMLAEGERIYGLGEDNANHGRLDRRGTIRTIWSGQQINSGKVTAEYPVPFWISLNAGRAFGCFVDNTWKLRFDLGVSNKDRLIWSAPGGPVDYYLIKGPAIRDVVERFTKLTGRPALLPLWAFGFWQSKCTFANFEDIENVSDELRAKGFPLDVMVIDYDWPQVINDFTWANRWYGTNFGKTYTPATKMAELLAKGIRIAQSDSGPMIKEEASNFQSGWQAGVFATDGQGKPVTCGHYSGKLLDFTHPGINDWLWPQLKPLWDDGIRGWWHDLTEPEGEPPQTVYHVGKSADIHNQFSLLMARSYHDFQLSIAPDSRPMILTRCGSAGIARYGAAVWTGDTHSDWPTFRAHVPEAQNSGLSGLAWWTSDSGGFLTALYKNDRYGAHAKLYERWMQFSCFSPITRAHHAGLATPLDFGPETEAGCRKYLKLRYRLMPYIYSLAREANLTGAPLVRPLVFEFQNDAAAADVKDQFMFGPALLVAPVVNEDAKARNVYFPPGKWIDFEEGCEFTGGKTIAVAAPRNRIPVAVRAGAILPLAPEMAWTGEKPWNPLTLEIFPSGESSFTLYRDDGLTRAFERGEFTETKISCLEKPGKSVKLAIVESNKKFVPQNWIARIHLTSGVSGVSVNGRKLNGGDGGWHLEKDSNILTVPFSGGPETKHQIEIKLDGTMRPRPKPPEVKLDAVDLGTTTAEVAPKQIPNFYPPPRLPNQIVAANYDKGGEGVAFHVRNPGTAAIYRADDAGVVVCDDVGGGYAMRGLDAGDWLSYTLDAGDGGWFTVKARVALGTNAGKITFLRNGREPVADINIPARTDVRWTDAPADKAIYLSGGEAILNVLFDCGGFDLGSLTFGRAANPPSVIEAEWCTLQGDCRVGTGEGGGFTGSGYVSGLTATNAVLTVALNAAATAEQTLSFRYASESKEPALVKIQSGTGQVVEISLPPTGSWWNWQTAKVRVPLSAGLNAISLRGSGGRFNLDRIETN